MNKQSSPRGRVPAAVGNIDLEKLSKRPKNEVQIILKIMEEVLLTTNTALQITICRFDSTGDGYLFALWAESAAKLIDYLRQVVPALKSRLAPYRQNYRMGVDFGFIHFQPNRLTKSPEYFDEPGVRATRLQDKATPNQILASDLVYEIYSPFERTAFGDMEIRVQTKDRIMLARELVLLPCDEVQNAITEFLLSDPPEVSQLAAIMRGSRILVIDDEPAVGRVITRRLQALGAEVTIATREQEALTAFQNQQFLLVLADVVLPGRSGTDIVRHLLNQRCDQMVILMSGHLLPQDIPPCIAFLQKPYSPQDLIQAMSGLCHGDFLRLLQGFCPDSHETFRMLCQCRQTIFDFKRAHPDQENFEAAFFSKIKECVHAFANGLTIGTPAAMPAGDLCTRIRKLAHLAAGLKQWAKPGLRQYLSAVQKDFKHSHPRIRFDVELPGSTAFLNQVAQLESLLVLCAIELIDNSKDAINGKGQILVRLHNHTTNDKVSLRVWSSGRSIPQRLASRIFEDDFSSKGNGRGIGLGILKRMVERSGGKIALEIGNGVSFTVTIPMRATT